MSGSYDIDRNEGVLAALREARPADPSPAEAERASVRVLARLAVLEAGRHAADAVPAARTTRRVPVRAVAAAILLMGFLSLPFGSVDPARTTPDDDGVVASTREAWIDAALAGDTLTRARARVGGAGRRDELLTEAERGGRRGRDALALLASWGAPRNADEVGRAKALASDAVVGETAIEWLGTDLGPGGARALGELLVTLPAVESEVVAALEGVARRGRREAATLALLEGVGAGRAVAAAAAVRVGGARSLERVLGTMPEGLSRNALVLSEVAGGARTLRARLVRLAERGDATAVRVGAGARLPALVPLLAIRAVEGDDAGAAEAVRLLAAYDTPDAWIAVGRAVEGPAGSVACASLSGLSETMCIALERRARSSTRQAGAALVCLACAGRPGLDRVRNLAVRPSLARTALAALRMSPDVEASRMLAVLSHRPALLHDAVAALGTRLQRGDETAGTALLALARGRHAGAVFRTISTCGDTGVAWLQRALGDPKLQRQARQVLVRLRVDMPRGGEGPRMQVRAARKRHGAL